jgi:hypothetical protein
MADGTANNRHSRPTAGTGRALVAGLLLLLAVVDLLHSSFTSFKYMAAIAGTTDSPDEEEADEETCPTPGVRRHTGAGRTPRNASGFRPRPSAVTSGNPSRPAPLLPRPLAHPKQNGLGAPLLC